MFTFICIFLAIAITEVIYGFIGLWPAIIIGFPLGMLLGVIGYRLDHPYIR